MKTIRLFIICSLLAITNLVLSQNTVLPDADLYTLEGNRISTSDITAGNSITVVLFWNMNDKESIEQLININELNDDSVNKKNVKIIAVCTDLNGYMQSVKPFIFGNSIEIDIYIDKNNELKRMMSIPETPCTLLFDKDNNRQAVALGSNININGMIATAMHDQLAQGK